MEKKSDIIFQLWQLERQLLADKLSLFLLTNSILFSGYVQIRAAWLGIIISTAGIFSCITFALSFIRIPKRLRELENKLIELEEKINVKLDYGLGAANIFIFSSLLFGIIWSCLCIFSILSSLT